MRTNFDLKRNHPEPMPMMPDEAKAKQSIREGEKAWNKTQHNNNNWKYWNTNAREQIRAQINYYFAQLVLDVRV